MTKEQLNTALRAEGLTMPPGNEDSEGAEGALWQAYRVGADGKRTPSGFVIPDFVEEHELAQFLEDLFHESASPHNGDVHRID